MGSIIKRRMKDIFEEVFTVSIPTYFIDEQRIFLIQNEKEYEQLCSFYQCYYKSNEEMKYPIWLGIREGLWSLSMFDAFQEIKKTAEALTKISVELSKYIEEDK